MLLLNLALAALVAAGSASTYDPAKYSNVVPYIPIVVPLATRSPYLGTYLFGSEDKNLAKMSPYFWSGGPIGWTGLLRVDGEVSNWMGNLTDYPACINASTTTDSYSSTFVMTNDPPTVQLTADFISPITPKDLFRQSLPFSYLSITVASLDGQSHEVDVYTEINGLWLADDETEPLEWFGAERSGWSGMRVRLENQRLFEEENGQEEHGNDRILHGDVWYVSRSDSSKVKSAYSAGDDVIETRRQFVDEGRVRNRVNGTFRSTRTRNDDDQTIIEDEPVFALTHSFGKVTPKSSIKDRSALITVGHIRDPIVQYKVAGPKTIELRPLWTSAFDSAEEVIDFFLGDYDTEVKLSKEFNTQLYEDARRVESEEYGHTMAVSTRQVFMALEGAVHHSPETKIKDLLTYNPVTHEPIPSLFMLKEVSSNGNCQTVDVIAPFLPFGLYACPNLFPLLLEPIYEYCDSGLWLPFTPIHDLGDHYPNATGHDDFPETVEPLPLEEAGNMLAMALSGLRIEEPAAKQQAEAYYHLLTRWADYLVREAIFPKRQSSTDDFFGSQKNTTSLVIKGIMGIRSMAEIASDLGKEEDQAHYQAAADNLTSIFLNLATSKDGTHLLGHYGNDSSWHSQYNLYFDKLLDTHQFPASVFEMEDKFYPTVTQEFGPALDSGFPERSKTDWLAWLGGVTSGSTRTLLVDSVAKYCRQAKNGVFGDLVTPTGGWSVGFRTRPVAGGHYALLGLDTMDRMRSGELRKGKKIAAGLGWSGLAMGLICIGLVVGVGRKVWQRRRASKAYRELAPGDESPLLERSASPLPPRPFTDEE